MEPNKFENQIREKLNNREIQPSAQAWDRLDAMLSVAEEKKTKRSFGWLYIAATILVFFSLGMFLFNQKNIDINTSTTVVTTEIEKDTAKTLNPKEEILNTEPKQENNTIVSTEKESILNNNQSKSTNKQSIKKSIINQETTEINQLVNNQNQKNNQNSIINRDKPIEYLISENIAIKSLPKIRVDNPKANQENNQKLNDILVSNLEETAIKAMDKKTNLKIDAKALLNQVDGELELSFREKVINSINKNYKNAKVAISNRNNQ